MLALSRRLVSVPFQLRIFSSTVSRLSDGPPSSLLEGEKAIHAKLTERFAPSQLKVQDVSGGCGTFYAITIASRSFQGLNTVKQHRLVTETLKKEIEGIHGLQIKTIPN